MGSSAVAVAKAAGIGGLVKVILLLQSLLLAKINKSIYVSHFRF